MSYDNILLERPQPGVALIRLNRPKALNALSRALMTELAEALGELAADNEVVCVVLTGNERAFAAGADISEFAGKSTVDMLTSYRFQQWRAIKEFPKPIIAAVSGFCLGGGNELAMHCDMIVAGENAKFGQPEINLGIMPGAGGTQRLTRAVGKFRAMEIILTGDFVDARQAHAMGLVNHVVPTELVVEKAVALAAKVASKAPLALQLAKESILKAEEMTQDQALDVERKIFYLLFSSEDKDEGVSAFLEKRTPQWKGR
ncbi:MAG: enoyl-CoA hydratase/isomerase family protein [Anaerolineales bacterium]|nr:enoyl-CoA hydratase/isomerase family protein [Anaerolineales bacterium]MCB9128142.1 enoyl-CoA hydratase/isomerase family protein [Ardenticatenales bacterium]MCB9171852.1 enoyl-CoA hydratase/isomerase family protein [Ardenticatenales bacterium]